MKKKFFLLMPAVIALASCSSEDVIEQNNDDAISFRAAVGHSMSSRGEETTTANLNKFYVTAIEKISSGDMTLFENLLFEKDADGNFVSTPPFKWGEKMELDFYALGYYTEGDMPAPNEEGALFGEVTLTPEQQTINNFSPMAEIADQIDLVAATATSKKPSAGAQPVSLTFDHLLSEVQVVAKCGSTCNRVLVKGIKYGNIISKGNYDFTTDTWTSGSDKSSYTVTYLDSPIELNNSAAYDHDHRGTLSYHDISKSEGSIGYAILLPQQLTTWNSSSEYWETGEDGVAPAGKSLASAQYIAVLVKIEALDNNGNIMAPKFPIEKEQMVDGTDGYGWAYIPLHADNWPEWRSGYRYIYHLDFTDGAGYDEDGKPILEGEIKFTASVNEWSVADIYKPKK